MTPNRKVMKLYTEEQVKSMINRAKIFNGEVYDNFIFIFSDEGIIESQTPIELPSDEEIEKEAFDFGKKYRGATTYEVSAYFIGAKWMRDKIQNK